MRSFPTDAGAVAAFEKKYKSKTKQKWTQPAADSAGMSTWSPSSDAASRSKVVAATRYYQPIGIEPGNLQDVYDREEKQRQDYIKERATARAGIVLKSRNKNKGIKVLQKMPRRALQAAAKTTGCCPANVSSAKIAEALHNLNTGT